MVSIHLRDDRAVEADETVTLSLSAITPGLPLSRASAPLWILDDERTGTPETNYEFEYGALGIEELGEITSILPVSGGRFLAQVIGTDANGEFIGVLAQFKGDGSFDPEFEPYPLPPTGGPAQVFRLNGGNRVLANLGGRLVRLDGEGHEDPEFQVTVAVTRLNANGSLDTSFKLGGVESFGIPPAGFIPPVVGQGLALLKDGDILVGMTQFQLGIKNDPVSYGGVVRLNGAACEQERDSDK